MPDHKSISFIVPNLGYDNSFLLETDDGKIFNVEIPEHISAGQRVVASLEDDLILLKYFHLEGEIGTEDRRNIPKLVIGRKETTEVTSRPKVYAQMDKYVKFTVPPGNTERILKLDDGRCFHISIPSHVPPYQDIVVSVVGTNILLEYFHNEGIFSASERPQLVIGNEMGRNAYKQKLYNPLFGISVSSKCLNQNIDLETTPDMEEMKEKEGNKTEEAIGTMGSFVKGVK